VIGGLISGTATWMSTRSHVHAGHVGRQLGLRIDYIDQVWQRNDQLIGSSDRKGRVAWVIYGCDQNNRLGFRIGPANLEWPHTT
jgi:hypothetical protein